jgi:hypothetical protein
MSSEELLKAARKLSLSELEKFVSQVIALQAQRRAPSLPKAESELLLKINQGIPEDVWKRYNDLITKRRAETLTPDEYDELLRLTDQIEALNVRRIEYLSELASLRKTSLSNLMEQLGIRTPPYE